MGRRLAQVCVLRHIQKVTWTNSSRTSLDVPSGQCIFYCFFGTRDDAVPAEPDFSLVLVSRWCLCSFYEVWLIFIFWELEADLAVALLSWGFLGSGTRLYVRCLGCGQSRNQCESCLWNAIAKFSGEYDVAKMRGPGDRGVFYVLCTGSGARVVQSRGAPSP